MDFNSFTEPNHPHFKNRSGNYHHIVKFRIQYTYGNPNIRVISNNFMSGTSGNPKFKQLRLAFRNAWPGIYTGCVLQFKLDSSTNTSVPGKVHMKIWQNCPEGSLSGGWKFDTRLFSNDGFGRPFLSRDSIIRRCIPVPGFFS